MRPNTPALTLRPIAGNKRPTATRTGALWLAAGLAVGAWGVGFAQAQVEVIYSTVAGANGGPC